MDFTELIEQENALELFEKLDWRDKVSLSFQHNWQPGIYYLLDQDLSKFINKLNLHQNNSKIALFTIMQWFDERGVSNEKFTNMMYVSIANGYPKVGFPLRDESYQFTLEVINRLDFDYHRILYVLTFLWFDEKVAEMIINHPNMTTVLAMDLILYANLSEDSKLKIVRGHAFNLDHNGQLGFLLEIQDIELNVFRTVFEICDFSIKEHNQILEHVCIAGCNLEVVKYLLRHPYTEVSGELLRSCIEAGSDYDVFLTLLYDDRYDLNEDPETLKFYLDWLDTESCTTDYLIEFLKLWRGGYEWNNFYIVYTALEVIKQSNDFEPIHHITNSDWWKSASLPEELKKKFEKFPDQEIWIHLGNDNRFTIPEGLKIE